MRTFYNELARIKAAGDNLPIIAVNGPSTGVSIGSSTLPAKISSGYYEVVNKQAEHIWTKLVKLHQEHAEIPSKKTGVPSKKLVSLERKIVILQNALTQFYLKLMSLIAEKNHNARESLWNTLNSKINALQFKGSYSSATKKQLRQSLPDVKLPQLQFNNSPELSNSLILTDNKDLIAITFGKKNQNILAEERSWATIFAKGLLILCTAFLAIPISYIFRHSGIFGTASTEMIEEIKSLQRKQLRG
jgi:hypothetical protein